jgi:hypothetical protein
VDDEEEAVVSMLVSEVAVAKAVVETTKLCRNFLRCITDDASCMESDVVDSSDWQLKRLASQAAAVVDDEKEASMDTVDTSSSSASAVSSSAAKVTGLCLVALKAKSSFHFLCSNDDDGRTADPMTAAARVGRLALLLFLSLLALESSRVAAAL